MRKPYALPIRAAIATAALLLAGCATVSGTPTQSVSIHAIDAYGRAVEGMRCRVTNSAADYFGSTPMFDLQVRRSASDLEIECRRGSLLARATAVSRGTHLISAVLPGGTAAIIIDPVTGYRYAYPSRIQLRLGEHLVFDPDAAVPTRVDSENVALN